MSIKKLDKQPSEVLDYDFDYGEWLTGTDTLESADITVEPGLTLDSYSLTDEKVKVWLSGGTDGETYKITCLATTADGREKEKEFKLKIKDN